MKIQSIQLKHILHFADLKIDFDYHDKPITLILGDQASGKTSILRFSYQALTWFAARYKDLRSAGVIMLDQDIMLTRLQSKIDIQISVPPEIHALKSVEAQAQLEPEHYAWQLYKTLNKQGIGISKAETPQLEQLVSRYQQAIVQDPFQGLPLIAYHPAERFVNEMNILSKNNPLIFQHTNAYEISAIPYTTFARFFEWFREISDIENAQTAQLLQKILHLPKSMPPDTSLSYQLVQAQAHIHSPSLQALKQALTTVLPEIEDIYLQYHPKLQLMVRYHGSSMLYPQLSNSMRNWVALVGDIVRRLCLLNPESLFPCLEGDGVLLIDAIDHQLDQNTAQVILKRLNQAFPRLQIIATGNRSELLEQASEFQCLKLEHTQVHNIQLHPLQDQFDTIYQNLSLHEERMDSHDSITSEPQEVSADAIFIQIQQQLAPEQQRRLIELLSAEDDASSQNQLS